MNKKMERKSRLALTLLLAGVTFAVELLFLLLMAAIVVTLSGTGVLKLELTGAINRPLLIALFVLFCLIVGAVVSHNSEKILSTGLVIFAIVILHNLLGYLCGYLVGVLLKMDAARKKAVSIEIGMQNSGLATTLASSAFPDLAMATVPGAIFSVWHNISGAVLAGIYRKMN